MCALPIYRLGHHVGNAQRFEHGAHRAAGDDAGPGGCRAQRHIAGTEMTAAIMVQRAAVAQRNANHRLLRGGGRLRNRFGHFARLAMPETGAPLAVPADHESAANDAPAALPRLWYPGGVRELFAYSHRPITPPRPPVAARPT